MARKKMDFSIADPSRNQSKYRDFTRNYRQSENLEDRRGRQFQPTETPSAQWSGYKQSRTSSTPPDEYSDDINAVLGGGFSTTTPTSSSRKVDAEEAIRRTHFERN